MYLYNTDIDIDIDTGMHIGKARYRYNDIQTYLHTQRYVGV